MANRVIKTAGSVLLDLTVEVFISIEVVLSGNAQARGKSRQLFCSFFSGFRSNNESYKVGDET
jgi:hypothetical protein